MELLSAIISIVGGLLATSSVIIGKKPEMQKYLDQLVPYQGIVGMVLLGFGLLGLFGSFMSIASIGLVWWIGVGSALSGTIVGFLLAYGLISKYVFEKDKDSKLKGQALRAKLAVYQVPAGVVLIILGVLTIIM